MTITNKCCDRPRWDERLRGWDGKDTKNDCSLEWGCVSVRERGREVSQTESWWLCMCAADKIEPVGRLCLPLFRAREDSVSFSHRRLHLESLEHWKVHREKGKKSVHNKRKWVSAIYFFNTNKWITCCSSQGQMSVELNVVSSVLIYNNFLYRRCCS